MQELLLKKAEEFVGDLSELVAAISASIDPFQARILPAMDEVRCSVTQDGGSGIPLCRNGKVLLNVTAEYECILDSHGKYLAVRSSKFAVRPYKASGEPLFRLDYVRKPQGSVPSSHMHIHAHRDAATQIMFEAGETNRRRGDTGIRQLSDLHFATGGPRFRPSLEDLIETLINEFGLDTSEGLKDVLERGRSKFRLTQLKTAVRDSPSAAVEQLEEMGYEVRPPKESPAPRDKLLTEI